MSDIASSEGALPVVVSIGFAGSRYLLAPGSKFSPEEKERFHSAVGEELKRSLAEIPRFLKWNGHHFACGISQVAIGADFLFTEACSSLEIPQRIFLPQARTEYLSAKGTDGVPDFAEEEKAEAIRLLELPHVIHERVVSHSKNRTSRFEDTNLEILRASQVIICLLRAGSMGKRGGTSELLDYGKALGKPVLEIQVEEVEGMPVMTQKWHLPDGWAPPELPEDLRGARLVGKEDAPSPGVPVFAGAYLQAIKEFGNKVADWQQNLFKRSAFMVIGTHLLATFCALLAMKMSGNPDRYGSMVNWLLAIELVLLVAGFSVHFWLHHSHVVRVWAVCRLSAEITRSVSSLRGLHVHLEHLFALPFPSLLRPLLRTVNVLYLASTKGSAEPWEEKRRHYLASRLDGEEGQIAYYTHKYEEAHCRLKWAGRVFNLATVVAFLATAVKLWHLWAEGAGILGICAVLLPVLAVGALSLAASFDLEARSHTYHEMLEYLKKVRPLFDAAKSERAFTHLMLQTESRLLGETANWASRRSFTGVT